MLRSRHGLTELSLCRRAYRAQCAQIEARAYRAQIVSTGLQSSVCSDRGAGLRNSDYGDGPTVLSVLRSRRGFTELRLWRQAYEAQSAQITLQAYGAQFVTTGLRSSDCGGGPTELRLVSVCSNRGVGLRRSDCGNKPTELSLPRSWRVLTELRSWRRAYGAQIVATDPRSSDLPDGTCNQSCE